MASFEQIQALLAQQAETHRLQMEQQQFAALQNFSQQLASDMSAAMSGRQGGGTLRPIIDPKILQSLKEFDGKEADWKDWKSWFNCGEGIVRIKYSGQN